MAIEPIEPKEEPKPLEMIIRIQPTGGMSVTFPILQDRLASYGFLKLAEKFLDRHYAEQDKKMIEPVKGGIMNFARNRMGR